MRNCEQKCSLLRERKRSMVNEQRLHSMIKIAKFDANDGKRCKPMIQYARKDYVALQLLKSFVVGTIAFFMMLGLWVLYSMDALMEQINKMDFVKAATTLGLPAVIPADTPSGILLLRKMFDPFFLFLFRHLQK